GSGVVHVRHGPDDNDRATRGLADQGDTCQLTRVDAGKHVAIEKGFSDGSIAAVHAQRFTAGPGYGRDIAVRIEVAFELTGLARRKGAAEVKKAELLAGVGREHEFAKTRVGELLFEVIARHVSAGDIVEVNGSQRAAAHHHVIIPRELHNVRQLFDGR